MISYDKAEVKEGLTLENIFDLLQEWGGEPEYTEFGIISATICHNAPGEGSRKLYYYENTNLFKCFTGCDTTFDIFELAIKIFKIQSNKEYDLNEAVKYIAFKFGIITNKSTEEDNYNQLLDWKILNNYDRIDGL